MEIYTKIREAFHNAGDSIDKTAEQERWDIEARALDNLLTTLIQPAIDQYNDGLIATYELVEKIIAAAMTHVE